MTPPGAAVFPVITLGPRLSITQGHFVIPYPQLSTRCLPRLHISVNLFWLEYGYDVAQLGCANAPVCNYMIMYFAFTDTAKHNRRLWALVHFVSQAGNVLIDTSITIFTITVLQKSSHALCLIFIDNKQTGRRRNSEFMHC